MARRLQDASNTHEAASPLDLLSAPLWAPSLMGVVKSQLFLVKFANGGRGGGRRRQAPACGRCALRKSRRGHWRESELKARSFQVCSRLRQTSSRYVGMLLHGIESLVAVVLCLYATLSYCTGLALINEATETVHAHRRLLALAWPISLLNLLNFVGGIVPLAFVGHLDPFSLSVAVLATSFLNVSGYCIILGTAAALETLCGQVGLLHLACSNFGGLFGLLVALQAPGRCGSRDKKKLFLCCSVAVGQADVPMSAYSCAYIIVAVMWPNFAAQALLAC